MLPGASLTQPAAFPWLWQLAGSVQAGLRGSEVCFQLPPPALPRSGGGARREEGNSPESGPLSHLHLWTPGPDLLGLTLSQADIPALTRPAVILASPWDASCLPSRLTPHLAGFSHGAPGAVHVASRRGPVWGLGMTGVALGTSFPSVLILEGQHGPTPIGGMALPSTLGPCCPSSEWTPHRGWGERPAAAAGLG